MADIKTLSERDICTKLILPALKKAGWDVQTQVREEVSFTDGRIYVKGDKSTRGKRKRADFILYYKPNIPIAIIEAKKNTLSLNAGIQQGIEYANILDLPLAYSSNGSGFYEHDKTLSSGSIERELSLDAFPSPEELTLAGKKVYVVGLGSLIICLDEQITLDTVEEIAKLGEKYGADDLMRVVFRDNGFKDAEVKTNAIQILKQFGIDDVKSL